MTDSARAREPLSLSEISLVDGLRHVWSRREGGLLWSPHWTLDAPDFLTISQVETSIRLGFCKEEDWQGLGSATRLRNHLLKPVYSPERGGMSGCLVVKVRGTWEVLGLSADLFDIKRRNSESKISYLRRVLRGVGPRYVEYMGSKNRTALVRLAQAQMRAAKKLYTHTAYWVPWAEEVKADHKCAITLLTMEEVPWGTIGWLSQQMLEKSLKAWLLVRTGMLPEATHSLVKLLERSCFLGLTVPGLDSVVECVKVFGPHNRYSASSAIPLRAALSLQGSLYFSTRLLERARSLVARNKGLLMKSLSDRNRRALGPEAQLLAFIFGPKLVKIVDVKEEGLQYVEDFAAAHNSVRENYPKTEHGVNESDLWVREITYQDSQEVRRYKYFPGEGGRALGASANAGR